MSLRITFILPNIGMSGGVKSTLELANQLHQRDHEVSVVYPLWPHRGALSGINIKRRAIKAKKALSNLKIGNRVEWFDLEADLIRAGSLKESNIPEGDIVAATWWANAYDVNDYGASKGEKFYIIRHHEIWGGPRQRVEGSYRLPLNRMATSNWLKGLIEESYGVEVRGPLHNGVDFNIFFRENEDFTAHVPRRIGILYRDISWKGMRDGLKALRIARKTYSNVKTVMFGEKPNPEDADMLASLGDVEYHTFPYGEELRRIYNSLDVFLFPSHEEGYGNPPMEAMACGVACVTTRVGGVPDYCIPGKTAIVTDPGNVEGLAEGILLLLGDEESRREMAMAASLHIRQFTWEKTADMLEGIFNDVLDRVR